MKAAREAPGAPFAGINLQYGLTSHRGEQVKALETDDGPTELRAAAAPAMAPASSEKKYVLAADVARFDFRDRLGCLRDREGSMQDRAE